MIGAGASGLPAIKACLENGLDVVCFEKTSDLGGLWNYRPSQKVSISGMEVYANFFPTFQDGGTVMASTVVNTSKEMMAYSDFPPTDKWPNFMHHSFVLEYMKQYAEKFDLLKYVKFNIEVKTVEKEGNEWKITLVNGKVETFHKVMLATGHHSIPEYPQFRGEVKSRTRVLLLNCLQVLKSSKAGPSTPTITATTKATRARTLSSLASGIRPSTLPWSYRKSRNR